MKKERKRLLQSLIIALVFVSLLWIVKLVEVFFGLDFTSYGLFPRTLFGIKGIFAAPFIHKDFQHLISNSFPILFLITIIFTSYRKVALKVFGFVFLLTGIWVWAAARPAFHIGASGLVYGFVSFLFFMGILRKDSRSMALALLVTFLYGGLIWGVFPIDYTISWESHLLGAIAGVFTALLYYKVDLPPKKVWPEEEEYPELPYWKYEVEGELKEPEEPAGPKIVYIYKQNDQQKEQ